MPRYTVTPRHPSPDFDLEAVLRSVPELEVESAGGLAVIVAGNIETIEVLHRSVHGGQLIIEPVIEYSYWSGP